MTYSEILFHDLAFSYPDTSVALLEGLNLHFPHGWSGIVGPNGAGKTTVLKLATGLLKANSGQVDTPVDAAVYCPQRTDEPPPHFDDLLAADDGQAYQIRGRLGIEADWLLRWDSLSHGERKRAQIGTALWRQPHVLAVDEPTNHLDSGAKALLAEALSSFSGVGLLVSHDRELLDSLCQQCLFVDPPQAVMRPGGFSAGAEQAEREAQTARHQLAQASRQRKRLEREVVRRRDEAARSDKRRSKRNLGKDNDARYKRNLARLTGKDGISGKLLRQMDGRLEQAQEQLEQAKSKFKKTHELGIWMPGARSRRDTLFRLEAANLPLGEGRHLQIPPLVMTPQDRIALTGLNGTGKSTLISYILPRLNIEEKHLTYVPQEIGADEGRALLDQARRLPNKQLGRLMTAISGLGSRPKRLLDSRLPSPGEVRKLLLALGIAREPHLIIMDEPTNHLDLPSIQCLEAALAQCPCGLLRGGRGGPRVVRVAPGQSRARSPG